MRLPSSEVAEIRNSPGWSMTEELAHEHGDEGVHRDDADESRRDQLDPVDEAIHALLRRRDGRIGRCGHETPRLKGDVPFSRSRGRRWREAPDEGGRNFHAPHPNPLPRRAGEGARNATAPRRISRSPLAGPPRSSRDRRPPSSRPPPNSRARVAPPASTARVDRRSAGRACRVQASAFIFTRPIGFELRPKR